MSGPAGKAKRRLDLVHLLNSQASTWRAPLVAPPVRLSDGLVGISVNSSGVQVQAVRSFR